jgi:5-methylcytosine-specific restriction endonuclease McrA
MNKKEKEVYEKTIELYNGQCAICGNPNIAMHHIRYGGLYGGRKTYMGNVIPLCEKHHRLVHTNKDKYMPMLIDMINKKILG